MGEFAGYFVWMEGGPVDAGSCTTRDPDTHGMGQGHLQVFIDDAFGKSLYFGHAHHRNLHHVGQARPARIHPWTRRRSNELRRILEHGRILLLYF